jgi:2-methylcitrate dehydratase PrpD
MAQPLLGFRKKHFSRSQMVIGAILATVENTNETLDTVIDSFKTPYEVDAKLSMATMGTII